MQRETVNDVVHVPIDGGQLEGKLVVPPDVRSLVLFAHGSGSSRFSPRNNHVADMLNQAGLATFLIDMLTEDEDKIDFKIKAKQFVKIYRQVACLVPFNIIRWEKLYWFLKFLIPKLAVRNPEQDQLDDLLNSIDLSTYGLERTRLNHAIGLDDSAAEVDPQNPNPRGYRDQAAQRDPLDDGPEPRR